MKQFSKVKVWEETVILPTYEIGAPTKIRCFWKASPILEKPLKNPSVPIPIPVTRSLITIWGCAGFTKTDFRKVMMYFTKRRGVTPVRRARFISLPAFRRETANMKRR